MLESLLNKRFEEIDKGTPYVFERLSMLRDLARELNNDSNYYEDRAANLLISYTRLGVKKAKLEEELDEITLEYQEDRAYNKEVLQRLVENNADLREQIITLKETNEKLTRKLLEKGL